MSNEKLPRRTFLKSAATVTGCATLGWWLARDRGESDRAATSIASAASGAGAATPRSSASQSPGSGASGMRYRTLGRTGLRVSEVGYGGYPARDPDAVRHAIDKGINYFDTSVCYTGGVSEETIGKGIKGRRQDVVVTTKWDPFSKTKAAEMLESLNTSLRRLQTDYVDCLLVHEVGRASGGESLERLRNSELFKAMEQAKSQGKARFFGCSGHDGDLMEVMDYAITIPEFSVILCRFNFMTYPTEPDLFKKAKAAGVGVVVMKTLAGARGAGVARFRDRQTTFKQAALKWALSNPDLTNLVISMSDRAQVDEYVKASGAPMSLGEAETLRDYEAQFAREVCTGCNRCESACPAQIPVADILRFRMYEKEYGWTGEGRRLYAGIHGGGFAAACATCSAPCQASCPPGIDIRGELAAAHTILG